MRTLAGKRPGIPTLQDRERAAWAARGREQSWQPQAQVCVCRVPERAGNIGAPRIRKKNIAETLGRYIHVKNSAQQL